MSRRSRRTPYVRIKVNIDATVMALVDMQIMDPVLRKPRYAERSSIVNNCLIEWLVKRGVRVSSTEIACEDGLKVK